MGPFFSIQYVFFLFFFRLRISLPKNLINNPVGVTTKKKTKPMTIGETILPRNIPNLNQSLLNGVKIDELNKPKIKKIIDRIKDQTIIFSLFNTGYIEKIKKTKKKTIPKLLFELILMLFFCKIRLMKVVFSCLLF